MKRTNQPTNTFDALRQGGHMTVTTGRIMDLLADAVQRFKREGNRGIDWVFFNMTAEEKLAFDLFLVKMKDELAWQAGTVENRFRERVRRMALSMAETMWT